MWKIPRISKSKKTGEVDNGEKFAVEKLNFSETIDIVFLVLPYIKLIKRTATEYKSATQAEVFRFMIQTLLEGMDKNDLYKAFAIALRKSEEDVKKTELSQLTLLVPQIIRRNNLLDLYLLLKRLGAIDGG